MMREILFRGKRVDNGEWVYGGVVKHNDYIAICVYSDYHGWHEFIEVIPETVGQCTGLTDKNGTKIFEGDVCADGKCVVRITSRNYMYMCKVIKGGALVSGVHYPLWHWDKYFTNDCRVLEVIGNIHDNPELLEVQDE